MGFYGNIASSNKSSFSFDLVYSNKTQMDKAAQEDGVFLGRYVLVEYDNPPITGWYNKADKQFYNTPDFEPRSKIVSPQVGTLYQDLAKLNTSTSFYVYDDKIQQFTALSSTTDSPYAVSYTLDVQTYGRGYDSTAWVKRYDPITNLYKYSMIAELNSVVPLFHMTVDPPQQNQIAPFFDRDSSNIDYYMHVQPQYSHKIRKAIDEAHSDEEIKYKKITWTYDSNDGETYQEVDETAPGDIYYNAAGFKPEIRTYDDSNIPDTINFEMTSSGRKYYDKSSTVYDPSITAPDTYEWFIKLPAIGNSICKLWDKLYGDPGTGNRRFMSPAGKRNDTPEHWVTYDRNTLIGSLNTVKELLGHAFIPKELIVNPAAVITNANATIDVTTAYPDPENVKNIVNETVKYKLLDSIFYTLDANKAVMEYWAYHLTPTYLKVADPASIVGKTNITYYYYDDNSKTYRVANTSLIGSTDADGATLNNYIYYTRTNQWTLEKLDEYVDDSVYGLMVKLHTLLGTNSEDVRNDKSLYGCINRVNDLVANISSQLSPGKLMHTNTQTGVIETTDTFFPSPTLDKTGVLQGDGAWVSRFATATIGNAESSLTAEMAPKRGIVVSDYEGSHSNNITFNVGNKWLRWAADTDADSLTLAHTLSSLQASSIGATASDALTTVQTDNEITLPWIKTDNAGHVIDTGTKKFYVPHNFKSVTIAAQSNSTANSIASTTSVTADNIIDNLTLATQNKWLRLSTANDDIISIGHIQSGAIAVDAASDTSVYGLPQTLDVATLDKQYTIPAENTTTGEIVNIPGNQFPVPWFKVDRAGHIVEAKTNTVTLPENFDKVTITKNDTATVDITEGVTGTVQADTLTDTLTLAEGNRWVILTTDPTTDTIKVSHYVKDPVIANRTIDQNIATNNKFIVQELTWDRAGHITNSTNATYTIPDNFKTISVGPQSALATNAVGSAEGQCIADNSIDELTLYTGNKWLNIAANRAGTNASSDDNITFSHILSGVTAGTYGLIKDTGITDLDADNTFEVPDFTVDEAGHITKAETHTVTIPENFSSIVVSTSDITVDSLVGVEDTIAADSLTDTLAIAEGNRWINISADKSTDKLTFSHYAKAFTETAASAILNPNNRSFSVQAIAWDQAGHIINSEKTTYTLPILTSMNKWLTIATDDTTNSITFTHPITAHTIVSVGDTSAKTPDFGATFKVPSLTADEAGHVTILADHTVKIPLPSLTVGTGNVMIGLTLEAATGKFTELKTNVGTLALTDYAQGNDTNVVIATDTINAAVAKLQNQILKEITDRGNAITSAVAGLVNSAPEALDTLQELSNALGNDANFATTVSTSIGKKVNGLASGTTTGHIVTWGADGYAIADSGFTIQSSVPANAKFTDTVAVLYTGTGTATNGAMTQKATTDAINEVKNSLPIETTIWQKKQEDGISFVDTESVPSDPGDYRCKLTRIISGQNVSFYSDEFTIE